MVGRGVRGKELVGRYIGGKWWGKELVVWLGMGYG